MRHIILALNTVQTLHRYFPGKDPVFQQIFPGEDLGYPKVFSRRGSGLSAGIFHERIRAIRRYFPGEDPGYSQVFSKRGAGLSTGTFQERIRAIRRDFPREDPGNPQVFSRRGSGLSAGISMIGSGISRVLSWLSSWSVCDRIWAIPWNSLSEDSCYLHICKWKIRSLHRKLYAANPPRYSQIRIPREYPCYPIAFFAQWYLQALSSRVRTKSFFLNCRRLEWLKFYLSSLYQQYFTQQIYTTADEIVETVLGSIPASVGTVDLRQCWI